MARAYADPSRLQLAEIDDFDNAGDIEPTDIMLVFRNGEPYSAVVATAIGVAITTTAWTAVTLLNGWSNVSGRQVVQVRKVEDIVFVRGSVDGTESTDTPIFQLAVGFRPPADNDFDEPVSGGFVDVASSGVVSHNDNGTPPTIIPLNLQFSITA